MAGGYRDRKRSQLRRDRQILRPLLFMLPALAVYIFVMAYPLGHSFIMSFHESTGLGGEAPVWVGLANYKTLFVRDPIFWVAMRNNLLWTCYSLVIPVAIGLILAMFLNEEFKGRTILRGIFYYPSILSLIAVGLIWRWMYHPNLGFLNALLKRIGLAALAVDWLGDRRTALFATFIANAWQATGIVMVMFLSGLQTIPTEVYEAARVEGAGGWTTFCRITLPLLRETYIVVVAITMVNAMKVFDVIFSMTWGGPGRATEVLATYLYFNAYKYFKLGVGTAVSWVLLLLIALVVVPYVLYMSRKED